jgi:hypothetical protein
LTKYGQTDLAAMAAERTAFEKEKSDGMGPPLLQLKEGKNVVRILPPVKGVSVPFHRTWLHYLRNPQDPTMPGKPVVCPLKTRGVPCIVCREVSRLRRSGNPADEEAAAQLRAGQHVYANAVDMNDIERGVQVFRFGQMIYTWMLSVLVPGDGEEGLDFTDPQGGFNIVIERAGQGIKTKYTCRLANKPSVMPDMGWLGQMHDLTKVVHPMDDERIRQILEGTEDQPDMKPNAAADLDDDAGYTPPRGR